MMNALFSVSLWLALIMSSCCASSSPASGMNGPKASSSNGNVGKSENEEMTTTYYDDYTEVTPTPEYSDDYDYNSTFDYYYVTMAHNATNNEVGKEFSDVMITQNEFPDSEVYNPGNEVSGIGQPALVLSLGLAVLQLWN